MGTNTQLVRETLTLTAQGLTPKRIRANLETAELYEHAAKRGEGLVTSDGALAVVTTPHTGRSPKDKFVVDEASSSDQIWWAKNERFDPARFDRLLADVKRHLNEQPEIFVQDLFAGADPAYRLAVRFMTPNAWQALFVRNMFIRPALSDLAQFHPSFCVYHAPEFEADPAIHGTRTGTFIVLNFA